MEETLLEQMTRVRPEVLDENALKLFNKIMEVIDERDGLQNRIDKAIEYIENNQLYYEDYDYDYEDELYLAGIEDSHAKKDLLEILGGDVDDE